MKSNNLDDQITNTTAEALAAIKVGVTDNQGFVTAAITLEELARAGASQDLYFHNCGGFGEIDYDLIVSNSGQLLEGIAHLRGEQQRTIEKEDKN